ncbi:hypothetical protein GCM10007304_46940 [Rhodococcoides trifolii]|uniref:Uncharacterized protein n=1 Tax=Rhodococcoides trifolii TaxID=908250 RepID=A0A917G8K6_9NOCA|nr:hypothetical protein GCM10007304_46940 [Rhodococcus trifolii]
MHPLTGAVPARKGRGHNGSRRAPSETGERRLAAFLLGRTPAPNGSTVCCPAGTLVPAQVLGTGFGYSASLATA